MIKSNDTVTIRLNKSQAETALRILREARDSETVILNNYTNDILSVERRKHITVCSDLWAVCRVLRVALNA